MSLIQQVAEWVHARSEGAISAEVAAEFALTVSKASIAIGQIHRESLPGLSTSAELEITAVADIPAASMWMQ